MTQTEAKLLKRAERDLTALLNNQILPTIKLLLQHGTTEDMRVRIGRYNDEERFDAIYNAKGSNVDLDHIKAILTTLPFGITKDGYSGNFEIQVQEEVTMYAGDEYTAPHAWDAGLEPNENYSWKEDQTLVQFVHWEKGQDDFGSKYSTYCNYNFRHGGKFSVEEIVQAVEDNRKLDDLRKEIKKKSFELNALIEREFKVKELISG